MDVIYKIDLKMLQLLNSGLEKNLQKFATLLTFQIKKKAYL